MASSPARPSQNTPDPATGTSRRLALSLVWAGWMLFILGWWLGVKHEDLSRLVVFLVWLLSVASFGGGIWQYLALARTGGISEQQQALLVKQRKVLSLGLLGGGLILVGLGLYLGISFKLAAFGEVVGMCLVGLIAVVCGSNLLMGHHSPPEVNPVFELLRRRHGPFGLVMLISGLILASTALVLILLVKLGSDWFPEMAALLLLGLLDAGGGIWLILSEKDNLTMPKMRVFVLVIGGVAGLILSLVAVALAFLWRDEVFGGMRAWQGDRGWRLWVCAYAELIGLALMFASLLLARADIRSNAVLRRALYGYNAVLTGLLLLAMLVVLNIVLFALFPFSFEWSKSRGAHTLSTSSKNLLNDLREPTTIYVLLPRIALTAELRNFLENCQSQSTNLEVKYVSPIKDFDEYEKLAKRFPDSLSGRVGAAGGADPGILIVYGNVPADTSTKLKVPHAFIPYSRLTERQPLESKEDVGKEVLVFKGESEVMNELSFLAEDRKKRKVYILQGDGELDINEAKGLVRRDSSVDLERLGCATLVERLKKDQYDVQGLTFAQPLSKEKNPNLFHAQETGPEKRKEVPDDAEVVIIAGPSVPLGAPTLEALERFMDRGRKLLVYLDVVVDAKNARLKTTGLEEFLRKYGVMVGTDFALRVPRQDDPRTVIATAPKNATNPLAKSFQDEPFPLDTVRIVRPDPSAQKYNVEVLLHLDPHDPELRQLYWEENAISALTNISGYWQEMIREGSIKNRLSSEPIPVALTVSEKLFVPGSGKDSLKPRLVVFGDAEMISNAGIIQSQRGFGDVFYTLTASALNWLSEKKTALVGPRTKESTSYTINPQKVNVQRVAYLPGWLMMLSILSLGAGIWVVRRR